jgi:hypothetical protein
MARTHRMAKVKEKCTQNNILVAITKGRKMLGGVGSKKKLKLL